MSELRDLIGKELEPSEWLEVTQERIDAFADATDDHQWIHVDPERAAEGPFGTTIAHGFLTLSLCAPLALEGARGARDVRDEHQLRHQQGAVPGARAGGIADPGAGHRCLGGGRAGRRADGCRDDDRARGRRQAGLRGRARDQEVRMTVADRFTGQVALITGGARGIGAATAARLAAEGADVVIADFDLAAAQETAAAIGGRAVQCDVTSREQVEAAVAEAAAPTGRLDILVTCAGIIRDNLLHKMTDDDWDAVINTHLRGTFLAVQAAQKLMVAQKSGAMVLISSTSALGNRGQANYSAAKAGLQGLAEDARDRARAVRDHRQLRRAGLHRDRDDRADRGADGRAVRGVHRRGRRADARAAGRRARGRRRRDRVPLLRRRLVRRAARSSTSAEARDGRTRAHHRCRERHRPRDRAAPRRRRLAGAGRRPRARPGGAGRAVRRRPGDAGRGTGRRSPRRSSSSAASTRSSRMPASSTSRRSTRSTRTAGTRSSRCC